MEQDSTTITPIPEAGETTESVKTGARNSRDDKARIRKARELATNIVDITRELVPDDQDLPEGEIPIKSDDLVQFGDCVKATRLEDGTLKLGGYLIRYSTENDPDVTGDYFTQDTDFGHDFPARMPVYFHHGMDAKMGKRRLSSATLTEDEFGIWAETILRDRDEYEKFLAQMAEAGKLGWSSGAASHLVERKSTGKANRIDTWIIAEAFLTHTPAEPRNSVSPLKSIHPIPQEEETTMEITEDRLTELISAAATKAAEEAVKSMPAVTPAAGFDVQVTKDAGDQPFKSAGEFFQAVKNAALYPSSADERLKSLKAASGMSEGVPADGGYLVSPTIAGGIVEKMYSTGSILSRVAMDNIGPNSNGMTYNAIDESSRVDGSRYGGLQGYWLAEAGSKTSSKPKFRQVDLKLKKVAALAYATDELLSDATALEAWLYRTVPNELRFKVEDAIYNGDGVGKPLGIMNAPCRVDVLRYATSGVAIQDIVNMYARRYAGYNDYVWLINQDVLPQLLQLVISSTPVFLPPGGLSGAPYGTLFGRPVIEVEYAATMGTVGDIVLASLSNYQAIQKGGIEAASSIHVQFLTDETVFRFVYRVDGAPTWGAALTPFKGSNTQSPFVALATATS